MERSKEEKARSNPQPRTSPAQSSSSLVHFMTPEETLLDWDILIFASSYLEAHIIVSLSEWADRCTVSKFSNVNEPKSQIISIQFPVEFGSQPLFCSRTTLAKAEQFMRH